MAEPNDFDALKNIAKDFNNFPLEVIYHPSKDKSEFSDKLLEIANVLVEFSDGKIKKTLGKGEGVVDRPALTFCFPQYGKINYLAFPEGPEFTPFSELFTSPLKNCSEMNDTLTKKVISIKQSTTIQVFIASECPNCPNAVRAANTLAFLNHNVTTTIIDVEQFPDLAKQYHILSVPMTVIDDGLLINKVIPLTQLAEKIINRGDKDYNYEHFLSLCNTGNFDKAAQLILDFPVFSDFLFSAWKKSTMSSRMELMLVAQHSLNLNPRILDKIVSDLISLLLSEDISLKGDTIDLLSQIGHPDAIEPIKTLLHDNNPDIVEIAEDALETLDYQNN